MPSTEEILINKAIEVIERHVRTCVKSTTDSDNELEQLSQAVYVWPEGQYFASSGTASPLLTQMNQLIHDKSKRVAVILGNPGAGKTTFAKRWLTTCLEKKKEDITQPLPLFIALSSINSIATVIENGEDLLTHYLKKKLGLSIECINQVKQDLPLIVFLDGYDEIMYFGNFYQDNHWHEWRRAQFVISTRPEKFGEHLRPNELEALLKLHFAPNGDSSKLELYELQDFSKENIQEFIQQWVEARHSKSKKQTIKIVNEAEKVKKVEKIAEGIEVEEKKEETPHFNIEDSSEALFQALQELKGLMELASNPVILSLILYNLPALYQKHQRRSEAERQQLMRIDVYDKFVKKWFKNQAPRVMKKLQQNHYKLKEQLDSANFNAKKYLRRYTQNLAYSNLKCSEAGKLNIEITADTTLHLDLLRSNGDAYKADNIIQSWDPKNRQALLKILRSGCLLKCDSTSFKFFHKSLIEYFTQAHLVQDVGLVDQALFRANQTGELKSENDFTSLSLNNMLLRDEPNVLSFLAERAEKDAQFKETLYQILRLSKKHLDIGKAAANAIMVLKRINAPLNKESWRKIKIPGADLSRAILHNVDFREADLQGANFANAYLEGANFEGALLSHCYWGSAPFVSFKAAISALACTWDNEYVLVGDEYGTIHYLELPSEVVTVSVTQKPRRISSNNTEKLKEYQVNALAVDGLENKKSLFFASACQQSIFLWNIKKQKYLGALEGHTATVTHLTYTADGQRLASSDQRGHVRLWDPIRRVALQQVPFRNSPQQEITFLAYTSENILIGITADARIVLESHNSQTALLQTNKAVKADKEEKPVDSHQLLAASFHDSHQLLAASFHPTIDCLAILSIRKTQDNGRKVEQTIIACWDIKTRRRLMFIDVTGKEVVAVTVLSTTTFVMGYSSGEMQLYEEGKGKGFAARSSTDGKLITQLIGRIHGSKWVATAGNRIYFRDREDVRWGVPNINRKILEVCYQSNPLSMWIVQAEKEKEECGVYGCNLKPSVLTEHTFKEHEFLLASLFTQLQQALPLLRRRQHQSLPLRPLQALFQPLLQSLCSPQYLKFAIAWLHQVLKWGKEQAQVLARELSLERVLALALVGELNDVNHDHLTPAIKAKLSSNINCFTYFSETPRQVALGKDQGDVELLTLEGDVVQRIKIEGSALISAMAYSPDGMLLAVASEDNRLHCFDLSKQKPLCVARLSTLEFTIRTLQFTQNSAGELELHAGAFKGNQLQSLVFQPLSRPGQGAATWQLISAWNKDFVPRWRGANLDGSTGLTQMQFRFLTQQGAVGKPATFFHTATTQNDPEEHADLKQVKELLKRIGITRKDTRQEHSVFDPTKKINLDNWLILLFRSSQIKSSGTRSGPTFFKASSQSSTSNSTHHVYGLLEGLNHNGQRVFIRIELVGPDEPTSYAHVVNKCREASSTALEEIKKAFLALFKTGDPEEITYQVAGTVSRENLKKLCMTAIQDQEKKYTPQKDWSRTRIPYKLVGGREDDAALNSGHNCLTWLRWRLSEISKDFTLPQNWRDRFYVDPIHALPRQLQHGFDASRSVQTIKLSSWPPTPSEEMRHDGEQKIHNRVGH